MSFYNTKTVEKYCDDKHRMKHLLNLKKKIIKTNFFDKLTNNFA